MATPTPTRSFNLLYRLMYFMQVYDHEIGSNTILCLLYGLVVFSSTAKHDKGDLFPCLTIVREVA